LIETHLGSEKSGKRKRAGDGDEIVFNSPPDNFSMGRPINTRLFPNGNGNLQGFSGKPKAKGKAANSSASYSSTFSIEEI
jgi:hypothetical protein